MVLFIEAACIIMVLATVATTMYDGNAKAALIVAIKFFSIQVFAIALAIVLLYTFGVLT